MAYAKDINLLAAGASVPKIGSTGSGIYSGKMGAIKAIFADIPMTRVLVADIPKVPGDTLPATAAARSIKAEEAQTVSDALQLGKEILTDYKIKALDFAANATQEGRVCTDNDFCCNYKIHANISNSNVVSSVVSDLLFFLLTLSSSTLA